MPIASSLLAEAIDYYIDHPVEWVEDMFGVKPDPWQAEALRALAAGKHVAIRSGHGVGKTALSAWAILWFLTTRPYARIPCTAPTQHQLYDILWSEIARWLNRSPLRSEIEWTATRVSIKGHRDTWFAVARASTAPENLAGFHGQHLLYVVDEASGVPDPIMQVVHGALTEEGARLLVVGNPTRPTGYFIERFDREDPHWHTATISSEDSPRVSRQWIEEMRREWGVNSDTYRVRVLGLPPLGEARAFIAAQDVLAAMDRYDEVPADGRLEIGVDVARYGDDKSAIVARRGYKVIFCEARHGLGNPQVAAWVAQVAEDLLQPGERAVVRVDDDGVGGGVTDLLRQMAAEGAPIIPIACTFGGKGNKWYANNTGVYWGNIRRLLREGKLGLPRDQELFRQLTTRTFTVNLKGKIVLERKEQMRDRGVPSPDKADALALAFAGVQASAWIEYLLELKEKGESGHGTT